MDSSFLISLLLLSASVLPPAEHGTSFARTPAPSDSLGITVADSLGPIAADSLGILVSDSLGPEVSPPFRTEMLSGPIASADYQALDFNERSTDGFGTSFEEKSGGVFGKVRSMRAVEYEVSPESGRILNTIEIKYDLKGSPVEERIEDAWGCLERNTTIDYGTLWQITEKLRRIRRYSLPRSSDSVFTAPDGKTAVGDTSFTVIGFGGAPKGSDGYLDGRLVSKGIFDSKGRLAQMETYSYQDGKRLLKDVRVFGYADDGSLASMAVYDEAGALRSVSLPSKTGKEEKITGQRHEAYEYRYDVKGRLKAMKNLDGEGKVLKAMTYSYSDKGGLQRVCLSDGKGKLLEVANYRQAGGRPYESEVYAMTGEAPGQDSILLRKIQFGKDGKIARTSFYAPDGSLIGSRVFDSHGNPSSTTVYGDSLSTVRRYDYKFDEHGSWTERSEISGARVVSVTLRTIDYYTDLSGDMEVRAPLEGEAVMDEKLERKSE